MMMNSIEIKNIELPKDDSRCAHILRTVIRNLKTQGKEMDSRAASIISANGETNQIYALKQKMLRGYLPSTTNTESRSASVISESYING